MDSLVRKLRIETFSQHWPLDDGISGAAATLSSHAFLTNPAGQYLYVYLTRFVKALSEKHFGRPFCDLSILDWGCGKGHVSKLLLELKPKHLDSCDIVTERGDSAFGQETPIIKQFGIQVKPLEHEWILPYGDATFDVVLSVGVLEHVPDHLASLKEIRRILKPGGLFFCFFLPTDYSWTQKIARMKGITYHDRLYSEPLVEELNTASGFDLLDVWYRQLFPKNTIRYPAFRFFEKLDQAFTAHTPLKYVATNIEFVSAKPL